MIFVKSNENRKETYKKWILKDTFTLFPIKVLLQFVPIENNINEYENIFILSKKTDNEKYYRINIIKNINDHCIVVGNIQNNYNIVNLQKDSSRKEEENQNVNKDKCIGEVLTQLYAEHYIKWKKDWAVIHRICHEKNIYDNL